jgi:hypothetical protein
MSKKLAVFAFAFVAFAMVANAQLYKTGDAQLNSALMVMDNDAKKDFSNFSKDMGTTYNVPETKIKTMSDSGMPASDIYMVLETSKASKKPVDDVVKVYNANKEKGWGAIAKELGIKPGSPEFHAMKKGADDRAKKSKSKTEPKKEPTKKDQKAKKQ